MILRTGLTCLAFYFLFGFLLHLRLWDCTIEQLSSKYFSFVVRSHHDSTLSTKANEMCSFHLSYLQWQSFVILTCLASMLGMKALLIPGCLLCGLWSNKIPFSQRIYRFWNLIWKQWTAPNIKSNITILTRCIHSFQLPQVLSFVYSVFFFFFGMGTEFY